jgi:predicted nuclease with TOPRIM domain
LQLQTRLDQQAGELDKTRKELGEMREERQQIQERCSKLEGELDILRTELREEREYRMKVASKMRTVGGWMLDAGCGP